MEISKETTILDKTDVSLKTGPPAKIQHLVLSGGSIYGFTFFAILRHLEECGIWKLADIKTIYATSVGTIISAVIMLGYDWDIVQRYLTHRPLGELIKFDLATVLNCVQNRGFFGKKLIDELFNNLLKGKDISPDVTMKEFFEITGIEIHYFVTKVGGFKTIDMSHKTHGEWKLTDVIYASCAIPPFLSPFFKDGEMYCDGGFLQNYPLEISLKNGREHYADFTQDSVLGIKLTGMVIPTKINVMSSEKYGLFEYLKELIGNLLLHISLKTDAAKITTEIEVDSNYMQLYDFTIYTKTENRMKLMEYGVEIADSFIANLSKKPTDTTDTAIEINNIL